MAQLTHSEIGSYRDQGYLLLREGLKPEDLASVRLLISVLVDKYARQLYHAKKISSLYERESFERRLAVINAEAKLVTSLWDLTHKVDSPALFDLIRHPALLDRVESLLGPEVAWTGSYVTRPKLPQSELTAFPWHQDSQYYGEATQHIHIVSVWIPLVDVDEHNGCLYVMQGSHNWRLLKGQRGADNRIRTFEDVEKRGRPVALPMRQGDILFFSNLTFHASKLNTTDEVRWSVDLRYVVPPDSQPLTEQERGAYDTLNTHYRVAPITVRSHQPEKSANLAQLQTFSQAWRNCRRSPNGGD
jgi:phytanoyl-CoA hydroxylase